MDTKQCTKCKRVKPPSEFSRCSDSKDGLDYRCRACEAERWRQRAQDPVKRAARAERERQRMQDPAKRAARAEYDRQRKQDPAVRAAKAEYQRVYRRANPDKTAAKYHARKARKAGNGGKYTALQWRLTLAAYAPDGQCPRCGQPMDKATVDHVIPIALGGVNDALNLQPLCKSCNSAKNASFADHRPDHGIQAFLVAAGFYSDQPPTDDQVNALLDALARQVPWGWTPDDQAH